MKKIQAAKEILNTARQARNNYSVTESTFDKINANMYSIFECYAHGIIDWDTSKKYFKESIKQYLSLYTGKEKLQERDAMKNEYARVVVEYKVALDEYKKLAEQKLANRILEKVEFIGESAAQSQSKNYYNNRTLNESELRDTTKLSWERVMEAYPNITAKDEERVRMLTIFEGPTVDTTQLITSVVTEYGEKKKKKKKVKENAPRTSMPPRMRPAKSPATTQDIGFEFNPRAGHRDQPTHPENIGLTPNTGAAPATSMRPKARPANLTQRNAINRAVQRAMGEGYKELPPMDPKYVARKGLEGPFSTLSGKVVYYDPKEGSYYDPDTDMYMSYDEFQQYDNDYSGMKDERDIAVKEAVAKIACLKCDEVSTAKAWQKNNDFCPKCKVSSQGVAEDINEEMSDAEVDAFHRALDELVHKHLGHSSDEEEMDESNLRLPASTAGLRTGVNMRSGARASGLVSRQTYDQEMGALARSKTAAKPTRNIPMPGRTMESEDNQYAAQDIMSEDPPVGIDFDFDNLPKVDWSKYSKDDIKKFVDTLENLDFEDGVDVSDTGYSGMYSNAAKWIEDNVLSKMEAKAKPGHNMMAQARLQKIMQQAIKDSKKKRGIEDDDKDRTDEMTSAGGIASVAAPMGKMKRRKDTIFASEDKESGTWYKDGVEMCSKECCGQPVTECTCGPECKHCDCYEKNKAMNESKKKSPAGGPECWDGKKIHPTKPTKMKGGKRVNNCIDDGK